MSELSKYLAEQILLEDNSIQKTIVVYSGRFQPMHKGHFEVYTHLTKKFGKENVFIGTSDKVEPQRSPFNFKEKKQIMTTLFPIPKDKVVHIKNPYNPKEILSKYDENTTAYIAVVSDKDASRLGGKYFKKYNGDNDTGYKTRGYVYISPVFGGGISASEIRDKFSDPEFMENLFYFKSIYPKYNKNIFNLFKSKLSENLVIQKETIAEWLLKEGTIGSFGQDDDGPLGFFPNYDVYKRVSISRAKQIGFDVIDMIMTKDLEDYYTHPIYPHGPVKAVSYYPAGVIGKMTPNNQIDIYSADAYTQWYKHITRTATLVGYELVQTQLQKSNQKDIKYMSGKMANADREIEKEFEILMNEEIKLPVEIGDTLLMGKWKNKKVVVKTIGKDEHGMPTINGKKVVTFRYGKKGPNIFDNIVELDEDIDINFKNLGISRKDMPQIKSTDMDDYLKYLKSKGISSSKGSILISKLKLTQRHISKEKVLSMMGNKSANLSKPIIVSSDGYILDGHHRVLALYNRDNKSKIPTVLVKAKMKDLLNISRNYSKAEFKSVNEMLTEATNKLKLTIPPSVKKINKAFKKHGKKVYVVGGAVRDAILGKVPHDFDLSTDAKAHEMVEICDKEGLRHIDTDIQYGTIVIEGEEVTQFRKDVGSNRKLDGIDYTDIEGDVKRRDLTINALFYDIERGEIVDLVGGIADLKKKLIRTVGKASDRFEEDHVRKLRAIRFTVKLGGVMDSDTLLALKQDPTLKDVSENRIRQEFIKSVESAKSTVVYLDLMEKLKFLKLTFPNLKITKPYINESDYILLMAHLLQSNSKDSLESKLNKLKYETKEIINITFLQSLIKFNPKEIAELKKQQKRTSLSDKQIINFGKHIKKDLKKFVKFTTSVSGKDAPKDVKGKAIGTWISSEETKRFLKEGKENKITTFKELFRKLPADLQKRVFALKHIGQNPKWHPEGNVLKHTILVVNRALAYDGDIDLALAALFHDIGKDETASSNLKTRTIQHLGHEQVSATLVKKHRDTIKSLGGNPLDVFYIVKNHMRMKNFDVMRLAKQRKLQKFRSFDKLKTFATKFDKGGLGEMSRFDLRTVEKYADSKLNPADMEFTNHFFDRVNDPRNGKEITPSELIGFFKRLSKHKKEFIEFLTKFKEFTITDKKTNINIPLVKHANKIIAKTVMRKKDWKSHDKVLTFEDKIPGGLADNKTLLDIANHHKIDIDDLMGEYRKGIKVELEHTSSRVIASEIARDHLYENPKYYTLLSTIEPVHESMENLYDDIDVLLSSMITENGKQTGGVPIPAEVTMKMYNNVAGEVSKMFKINKNDIKPIGSTGKKKVGETTGDIDMAIDAGKIGANFKLKFDEVQNFIFNKIKGKYNNAKNSKGIGVISFLYPIPNSEEYGQVDIMLSDNLDLISFMYHSPNFIKNESKYKGLYRNIIFTSIIKYIKTDDIDKYFEDGSVKEFSKYSLTGTKGLMKQLKSFEGKNGKIKNAKTIKGADQVITQVPIEIVKFVLGDEYTVDDTKSFESIYKIMNKGSFRHKDNNKKVIDSFKEAIIRLKLPLPSEIN